MLKGKAKDDDLGFVETQEGLVDGQGLIFLQHQDNIIEEKPETRLATLSMIQFPKTGNKI